MQNLIKSAKRSIESINEHLKNYNGVIYDEQNVLAQIEWNLSC